MEESEKKTLPIHLTSQPEKVAPLFVINTQITSNLEDRIILLSFHSGSIIGPLEQGVQAILAGTFALPVSQIKKIRDELDKFLKEIGEE